MYTISLSGKTRSKIEVFLILIPYRIPFQQSLQNQSNTHQLLVPIIWTWVCVLVDVEMVFLVLTYRVCLCIMIVAVEFSDPSISTDLPVCTQKAYVGMLARSTISFLSWRQCLLYLKYTNFLLFRNLMFGNKFLFSVYIVFDRNLAAMCFYGFFFCIYWVTTSGSLRECDGKKRWEKVL